jgi:hypothetical protein
MKVSIHDVLSGWVRITLDGMDVTRMCRKASEEYGAVAVFAEEEIVSGPESLDEFGEPKMIVKRGKVEISLRNDAPTAIAGIYQDRRASRPGTAWRAPLDDKADS